jgi:2-polyprenyl-6-methoxyphenol hydroxylase-like FAD-dependent oxidoreductase
MARLRDLIATRTPWCAAQPTQIYWSTSASFPSRLARTLGSGAAWLAGDAAHLAAPVGVQSMNSGLVEARELASRMAKIQHASGAPLDEFGTETHKRWEWLLDGAAVRALPGAAPWVQQNGARIFACLPASGDDVEPLLGQIHLTVN